MLLVFLSALASSSSVALLVPDGLVSVALSQIDVVSVFSDSTLGSSVINIAVAVLAGA